MHCRDRVVTNCLWVSACCQSLEVNLQLWAKSTLQQEAASRQAGTAVQRAQAASPALNQAACSCSCSQDLNAGQI